MAFTSTSKRASVAGAIVLLGALYIADLTGMGIIGPDEPRYAAVGRAMAQSGDWITPRLWGQPWFEKPALLYWMTAAGFRLGLDADLAPRLPVALLSVAFLIFFWWRLRLEWGGRMASYSTAILATTAGWLTYSHVALTDIPLAVFFASALLLSLPWVVREERAGLTAAGGCLGLAVLAKGLVPLVLFVPLLAIRWRRLRDWLLPGPLLAFSLCALPWYVLCTARNGKEFLQVFFVEHQFGRFASPALQHVQPWWFYIPASLLLLYPWFPLLPLTVRGWTDIRLRALGYVVLFGFVFFSVSVNKLPGYVLPLLPPVCTLIGASLSRTPVRGLLVIAPMALIGALPSVSRILPAALAHGLRSVGIPWAALLLGLAAGALAGVILAFGARSYAFHVSTILLGAAFLWLQIIDFPQLDKAASARPRWLASKPACISGLSRNITYGLSYYADRDLPECTVLDQNGTSVVR